MTGYSKVHVGMVYIPAAMEKETPAVPRGPLSLSVTLKSANTEPVGAFSEISTLATGLRKMGALSLKSWTVMLTTVIPVQRWRERVINSPSECMYIII